MNNIPDKEESTMDQPVDPVYRRNLLIKRVIVSVVLISAFILFVGWGIDIIRASVKRIRIRTAVAEIVDVTETIRANGALIPEFEQVLTSPMTTTVVSILKQPGDLLQPGDALLVLDTKDMELQLSKLQEQILIKRNLKEKIQVDLDVELNELENRLQGEKLQLKAGKARYEAHKALLEHGAVSIEKMNEAELAMEIARIEVNRVEHSMENAVSVSTSRLANLNEFMQNYADIIRLPDPKREEKDVLPILRKCVDLFRSECEQRGIEIAWHLDADLPFLSIDQGQMEQVFINIIKNAMEAVGNNGRMTLKTGKKNGTYHIIIEDTGQGLSDEVRNKLFRPFFSTKENGQGVGLMLVQEILNRHHFDFTLEAYPAGPIQFTIFF